MAEKKVNWTRQQTLAIQRRAGNVFVSASAGTGKTAVLSGRCVFFIADKDTKNSISDMLLLTFTDAAAAQMQCRIRSQLQSILSGHFDKIRLFNELSLLPAADISTIHSFCKKIISEYFYRLKIDPAFRVIDEDEQHLLKLQALEQTIEWAWDQDYLVGSLERFFYNRDQRIDGNFSTKIIALSDFLDSVLDRSSWLERARLLSDEIDLIASDLGREQQKIILKRLQKVFARLSFCQRLLEAQNLDGSPTDWQKDFYRLIEQTITLLKEGSCQNAFNNIRNFEKPKKIVMPKDLTAPPADIIKSNLKFSLDEFVSLKRLAVLNPDYLDSIAPAVREQTALVVELVGKFGELYAKSKRSANCLDFADLEHYALNLLYEAQAQGKGLKPSSVALSLRKRYKYIFVDEYQDINLVQQAVLDAISTADNVFVVGDVKQSIYTFRGAEPKIFIEHLKPASTDPSVSGKPLRIDLNANFRSSPQILDFVNAIFAKIMTVSIADIDYDNSAALRSADQRQMTDSKSTPVELHILEKVRNGDKGESDDNEAVEESSSDFVSPRQSQAFLIAQRIRQMVGSDTGRAEFKIYDRDIDDYRDVRFRDIAVLLRSPAKRVNDYVRILQLAGIPVRSDAASQFFEASEISDMLCLLKVLDNTRCDIPLTAVLRSPVFSLTDSDLAKIKLNCTDDRRRSFYDRVLAYSDNGPDRRLADKLKRILDSIFRWRSLAAVGSLSDLIWNIYRETSLLSYVSALPSGHLRRANLLKLHDRAMQFELFATSGISVSLARFVDFIDKLRQADAWTQAETTQHPEDDVLVTSVHKCKGLEFPVVFLAELEDKFNCKDLSDDFLADSDLTLGLQVIDRSSNSKIASLAHQVIAEKKRKTLLAEEMRILYVALTRASGKLVLTGSLKKSRGAEILLNSLFAMDKSDVDLQLESYNNFLEWIIYGLSDNKTLHCAFETGFEKKASDRNLLSIALYGSEDISGFSGHIERLWLGKKGKFSNQKSEIDLSQQSQLLDQLKKNLSWTYQYEGLSSLPAKRTVSLLTHSNDEFVRMDRSNALQRRPGSLLSAQTSDIDARTLGTAVHLLISRLDLIHPVTKKSVNCTVEKLIADGCIDSKLAGKIDNESIIGFFKTDLGRLVFEPANSIFREWPFTFYIPASELSESSPDLQATRRQRRATGDEVVVQGIIDMLIKTSSDLVIIDFKTDNITADRCFERAKVYQSQLNLYARAAKTVFGLGRVEEFIYFLTPHRLIEVD